MRIRIADALGQTSRQKLADGQPVFVQQVQLAMFFIAACMPSLRSARLMHA